jgi:SpoVK/Ycf46/Vps4 family AAA+-type ATPase
VSVVVTVMTDGQLPRLPGLRPGRIDEMFEFQVPDADGQKTLLEFYAPMVDWSAIVGHPKAKGMTPAYLRELAQRVKSGEDMERALTSLALQVAIAT